LQYNCECGNTKKSFRVVHLNSVIQAPNFKVRGFMYPKLLGQD